MTLISYDVVSKNGGWRIACGDTIGPPYNRKTEALRDVQYIARLLRDSGDDVVMRVDGKQLEEDGPQASY